MCTSQRKRNRERNDKHKLKYMKMGKGGLEKGGREEKGNRKNQDLLKT